MPAKGFSKIGKDEKTKKQFISMCRLHCTEEEICAIYAVSIKALRNWTKEMFGDTFAHVYKSLSAGGNKSLRRYQFDLAERSPQMAIQLGKYWLSDQKEKDVHVIINAEEDDPITKAIKASITNVKENIEED